MKRINVIAACDEKMGIGISEKNDLPWGRNLPGDLGYFHKITTDAREGVENIVVMGRKTWESIPESHRPLKGRINVVVTRNPEYEVPEGVYVVTSYEEAIELSEGLERTGDIFICGGGEIYKLAMKGEVDQVYLTYVEGDFGCDVFFPEIGGSFDVINRSEVQVENGISYTWVVYQNELGAVLKRAA